MQIPFPHDSHSKNTELQFQVFLGKSTIRARAREKLHSRSINMLPKIIVLLKKRELNEAKSFFF